MCIAEAVMDANVYRLADLSVGKVLVVASPRQSQPDGHKGCETFSIIKHIKRKIRIFTVAARVLLRRNWLGWFSFLFQATQKHETMKSCIKFKQYANLPLTFTLWSTKTVMEGSNAFWANSSLRFFYNQASHMKSSFTV